MRGKLKYWLIFLFRSAKKEYSERPIATTGVLVGIFVVVLPLLISESLRGFVVYLLSKVFLPKTEASLFPLIIAVVVLAVAFIPSKKIQSEKNHYFIDYDDFTWKVHISPSGHHIDREPYCKEHRTRMASISNETYICPMCGSPGKKLPYKRLSTMRELVQNLADATADNHLIE